MRRLPPAQRWALDSLAPSRAEPRARERRASVRVLLVEDNPAAAMRIQQLLARSRDAEVGVDIAADVESAQERLASPGVDAVLLSVGARTAEDAYLRIALAAPRCPVLVLTGPDQSAAGLDAVRQGAQDWVVATQAGAAGLSRAILCAMERHRVVCALRGQSLTDELTGQLNRRGFVTMAETHLRLGNRTGSRFLLMFADVDGLKRVNDTYGHACGDELLVRAGAVLRSTFRQSDVVARFGGDEFAILALDGCDDGGRAVLGRLEQNLAAANATEFPPLELSVGGVAFDATDDRPLGQLLAEADRALYAEKRSRINS